MSEKNHATAFFFFGALGLLLLISLMSAVYVLFKVEPQSSTLITTPTTVVTPTEDPLVSVVPNANTGVNGAGASKTPAILPTDPHRGGESAKVNIIEFGDFQCEQCANMGSIMSAIMNKYGTQVQHVWKDMPFTSLHPQAEAAAMAARCAAEQGQFWEYHDALLQSQSQFATLPWAKLATDVGLDVPKFTTCLSSAQTQQLVIQSYFVGNALGIDEVPTYFINNRKLVGPQTQQQIEAVVEEELR